MSTPAGGTGLAERLVSRVADRMNRRRASRRDFLGGAALVGAAMATAPWSYLTRPADAYTSLCGTDAGCDSGYTVFCCTINGGRNSCPPNSFIGGWWKADHSNYCGGAARYYIDCNSYRGQGPACHCNTTSCDHRFVNCNQFRYGQCNTQISWAQTGPVLCRMISCTPPWKRWAGICSSSSATDNNTAGHTAPCLGDHAALGNLSAVVVNDWRVSLRGWAYDPDDPSVSVSVVVREDDVVIAKVRADKSWPAIDPARKVPGRHGFAVDFSGHPGRHTYRLYATSTRPGVREKYFASATRTIGHAPSGALESGHAVGSQVRLTGYAFDRDTPARSLAIEVRVGSTTLRRFVADRRRPDIDATFHVTGAHGFDVTVPGTPGTHTYTVLAQGQTSTDSTGPWRVIGRRSITIG